MSDIIDESRTDAEARSRGCPYCSGGGMATVYHRLYRGGAVLMQRTEDGREHRSAVRCAAHCVCAAGRWIRSKTRDLDTLSRVPDLADVLAGSGRWARWQATDPTRGPAVEVGTMSAREMRADIGRAFRVVS